MRAREILSLVSLSELRKVAKKVNLANRSGMTKNELINALLRCRNPILMVGNPKRNPILMVGNPKRNPILMVGNPSIKTDDIFSKVIDKKYIENLIDNAEPMSSYDAAIPISELIATEKLANPDIDDSEGLVNVALYRGDAYVVSGHNLIAALHLKGKEIVWARVVEYLGFE